jgi:hypothetical protein
MTALHDHIIIYRNMLCKLKVYGSIKYKLANSSIGYLKEETWQTREAR